MGAFTISVAIDAPAEDAWDVVADYRLDAEWRSEVVSMVPTPSGLVTVGTTTAEVGKMMGSTFETAGHVVAVDPGRSFSWRAESDTALVTGTRTVVPTGARSCRVELTYEMRSRGAARLAGPLVQVAFRRLVRGNLPRLAALVRSRASTPA